MKALSSILPLYALAMFLSISGLGCNSTRVYDLSNAPPFSAYVGKDVVLTQDILVVDLNPSQLPIRSYEIIDPALPDAPGNSELQQRDKSRFPIINLPTGTKVHIEHIDLTCHSTTIDAWYINATVSIEGIRSVGWPQALRANFNYAPVKHNNWISPTGDVFAVHNLSGTIRPAPWEPLDTSRSRSFEKPRGLHPD